MEPAALGVAVDPSRSLSVLAFLAGGVALGTVSGLTPGLHANTFAVLLAGIAPSVPGPTSAVAAAVLAAGTVHTFLDIVPALALGVPDGAMAPTALPGHRLVLAGRGHEALRLSALGSGLAVGVALTLALPVTALMGRVAPLVTAHRALVMAAVAILLVVTESSGRATVGAVIAVVVSGCLGIVSLRVPVHGLLAAGSMLTPLFAGLFGAPVLLDAIEGGGVPEQTGDSVTTSRAATLALAVIGTLAGGLISYLPGLSSGIAATVVLLGLPAGDDGPRRYVLTTSAVNTATAVFALFSLVALDSPHTGVTVALDRLSARPALPVMLASVVVAAGIGTALVPLVGDRYLQAARTVAYTRLSVGVLAGLLVLSAIIAGPLGVGVFAASTVVGRIPPAFGTRRVTLMGVLLVPLATVL